MASAGLLALLDDIATVLDDVAVMAKLATKKTMAIAGDDLAVGAQSLVGLHPSRELPIVWAVAKGSMWNKAWLVPAALILTLIAPWSLTPILMFGGAFLCYEGVHKSLEKLGLGHADGEHPEAAMTPAELEQSRIRGAIRTDVILSAEIVAIALGAMVDSEFWTKALTLTLVAVGLTIAIYGLIAIIVKADDVGLHLVARGGARKIIGRAILFTMPPLMKIIGVLGTLAMFLVGGGIIAHGIPGLEPWMQGVSAAAGGGFLTSVLDQVFVMILGVIVGFIVIGLIKVFGAPVSAAWKKVAGRFAKKT